jgi:hypothetical protein
VSLLCALAVASLVHTPADPVPPESLRLASGLGELPAQELPTDIFFLGSAGFRELATWRLQQGGHSVDVFLAVGWRPGRARSARSPKTALPGSGWIVEGERIRSLGPDDRAVRQLVLRSGTQAMLVYHWYEGDAGLAMETIRSLLALDSSPLRRLDDILAVRIATPIEGPVATGLEPAGARLDEAYATLREVIDLLPGRSGGREADGTAFLDFPVWENFFHPTRSRASEDPESIQLVGPESAPGIRLAKQSSPDGERALSSGQSLNGGGLGATAK